ncbi:MAG TPA: 4-(cytidine 5'-diphospho)-2-C-methyl-D-erythritol kinase [Cyclobacteriaceae bacterium]|nr:4-(cytidine 5'-diphospho)-2-C-methyl-D-erythritol kinase [Cyclobacteriaceae bacterium]
MVSFPFCKINLGLQIVSKRSDNYHNIVTCFYPVPWTDVLEVIPSRSLAFTQTGLTIPGTPEDNFCLKAYNFLKEEFKLRPVKIHLHKVLPAGSGLGGGSSDAAHMLTLLNTVFKLGLSVDTLKKTAMRIGSDCSFFLQDSPAIGRERGDVLTPVSLNLKGLYLVVVVPAIHVSTAEAYAGVTPQAPTADLLQILEQPVTNWRSSLKNDFEPSMFKKYPVLQEIKEKLYSIGAVYASMSGSGSSIYGIFDTRVAHEKHFKEVSGWSGWL